MSDALQYRWTGDVAFCTSQGASRDLFLMKGSQTASLMTHGAHRLTLEIGDSIVEIDMSKSDWEMRKLHDECLVLVFHERNGFFLFRVADLEQSKDFQLYLESIGNSKTVAESGPSMGTADPNLAEKIKSLLADPTFHDYVTEVERVWDHVAAELADGGARGEDYSKL